MTDWTALDAMTLSYGRHGLGDDRVCAIEARNDFIGERQSRRDQHVPGATSRVIDAFLRAWNDALPGDEARGRLLKPLLPLTVGIDVSDAAETRRVWMLLDWQVRTKAVIFFRAVPALAPHADALAALLPIDGRAAATAAKPTISAAGDAARAAAWDAAGAAAGAAARAAARAAAWDAAGDAARAAAGAAAGAAARAAARAAAWDAAGDAARAAAWDAARDAARAALAPLVAECQTSAQDLIRRMCEVTA